MRSRLVPCRPMAVTARVELSAACGSRLAGVPCGSMASTIVYELYHDERGIQWGARESGELLPGAVAANPPRSAGRGHFCQMPATFATQHFIYHQFAPP